MGVGGSTAAVELERVQAQYIHAKADNALSESRLGIENEALCPLLGLALRIRGVDEIAVDVEVAHVETRFRIFNEPRVLLGNGRRRKRDQCQPKGAGCNGG